jgi:predicted dehydrogenase
MGIAALAMHGMHSFFSPEVEEMIKRMGGNGNQKKLGIALVGLGNYSTTQLAPALQQTSHCYLAGIVTGTPEKAVKWKEQYKIPQKNIYNYENFDSIKNNTDIDIIYVVLPNFMHAEFVVRAAKAGKHVICEKPMALTVEDCDKMIAACKSAGRMLSVGYRLHFEPYNREMMRLGQQKVFGNVKYLKGGFGFPANHSNQWRLTKDKAGGGPLVDVGIYVIQAFCYVTGTEPISVIAKEGPKTDPEKFRTVEQSLTWQFEMPGGIIADGETSYAQNMNFLRAEAENGWFELPSAYNYTGQRGRTSQGEMKFPLINQQAAQMDDFSLGIKDRRPSPVPGEMGRRDVKILQAVYKAMETGKRVII